MFNCINFFLLMRQCSFALCLPRTLIQWLIALLYDHYNNFPWFGYCIQSALISFLVLLWDTGLSHHHYVLYIEKESTDHHESACRLTKLVLLIESFHFDNHNQILWQSILLYVLYEMHNIS